MTTLTHLFINFLIPYLSGIGLGVYIGWTVFDHRFYRPLRRNLQRALDGWQQTINLSVKVAKATRQLRELDAPEKTEDGLILSPLQVNFPWKRKKKDEDDEG